MLTARQIEIIKATVPAVAANARDITEVFYPLMFERYPLVKAFFNQAHQESGSQRQALANAIIGYARNIDRLEELGDLVSMIAQKHCSLDIRPEHYPIVGECLLAAIQQVLGEAATDEVLDAWAVAYQQLADILIGAEEKVYQANAERLGGWRGERAFKVASKVRESEVITSFHLLPVDGEQVISFQPGQYVTVVLQIDGRTVRRNYSLSDAPGKQGLRISVKREAGGEVSNYLHELVNVGDELAITAPCGDFVLEDNQRPLALVTGGVGITPAISMLNSCVESGREIIFVHAAINSDVHAFEQHVSGLAEQHSNLKPFYIYSEPLEQDQPHATGYVTQELLADLLPNNADVDFYFLGPKPFMQAVNSQVEALGIPPQQVRYEFFGPLQDLAVS